jgi:hypothetical protein
MIKKITLYMETTKKEPEETIAEIQKVLRNYNLKRFVADYEGGQISGCIFAIEFDGQQIPFKMPVKWEPLWKLAKEGKTRYIRDERQARRVAWRQVLRWIEAQLALVDTRMADFHEVFLPYIVNAEGMTVFQKFSENNFRNILSSGDQV